MLKYPRSTLSLSQALSQESCLQQGEACHPALTSWDFGSKASRSQLPGRLEHHSGKYKLLLYPWSRTNGTGMSDRASVGSKLRSWHQRVEGLWNLPIVHGSGVRLTTKENNSIRLATACGPQLCFLLHDNLLLCASEAAAKGFSKYSACSTSCADLMLRSHLTEQERLRPGAKSGSRLCICPLQGPRHMWHLNLPSQNLEECMLQAAILSNGLGQLCSQVRVYITRPVPDGDPTNRAPSACDR